MILLNFSHPLTREQIHQIEDITGQPVDELYELPVSFDNNKPFRGQLHQLMEQVPLSTEQLQTTPTLVNPPALNFITALLMAEFHGRTGFFPTIVRLRPVEGSLSPRYEVAEVINLQSVRNEARGDRFNNMG